MHAQIVTIASYTFLEAIRNRLLWLVMILLIAGFGLAEFLGAVAITETVKTQVAIFGPILRLGSVFIISLFVVTTVVREMSDKGLEFTLSFPLPRSSYCLGKMAGFAMVVMLIAVLMSLTLLIYVPATSLMPWGISLLCELLLIAAWSLLCVLTFSQVTLAFSTAMAFYLLSRAIATIQLIGRGPLSDPGSASQQVMNGFIDGIAFLIPSLDRFTLTEWLVYEGNHWQAIPPILGQTLIYLVLLMAASMFDLYRKNF